MVATKVAINYESADVLESSFKHLLISSTSTRCHPLQEKVLQ